MNSRLAGRAVLQVDAEPSIHAQARDIDELTFLAQYFDLIEINVTFYRADSAENVEGVLPKFERNKRFGSQANLGGGHSQPEPRQ